VCLLVSARLLDAVAATDRQVAGIMRTKGLDAAEAFLSNFSTTTADAVVDDWVALFPELLVTFRDGLIVSLPAPKPARPEDQPPPPDCTSPVRSAPLSATATVSVSVSLSVQGYDTEWYQRVVAATGDSDRYLLPPDGNVSSTHSLRKLALLSRG
jgi:hypothetical protein